MRTFWSPPQLAKEYGVNPGKVLGWIGSGELSATNVAANLLGRPRWRISPADIAIFEQRRSSAAPLPKSRPRRNTENVIQFF